MIWVVCRTIFSCVLIFFVHKEAGVATAIFAFLFWINMELTDCVDDTRDKAIKIKDDNFRRWVIYNIEREVRYGKKDGSWKDLISVQHKRRSVGS